VVQVLVREQRTVFTLSKGVWLDIEPNHTPRRGCVVLLSTVGYILQQHSDLQVIDQRSLTSCLIPKTNGYTLMVNYLPFVCFLVSFDDRCRGQVVQVQTVREAVLGEELKPFDLSFVVGFPAHDLHTVVAGSHLKFVWGLLPEVHLIISFVQADILHVMFVGFVLIGPVAPINQVEVPKHGFLVGAHPIDHDRDPLTLLVVSGLVARLYECLHPADKCQG